MQQLRYSKYITAIIVIMDVIAFTSVLLCFYNYFEEFSNTSASWIKITIINVILIAFWLLLSGKTKLYSIPRSLTFTNFLERVVTHTFLFIVGVLLISQVLEREFIKQNPFAISVCIFLIIVFEKSLVYFFLKFIRTQGKNHRNVMFLGEGLSLNVLRKLFEERKDYGYKVFEYENNDNSLGYLKEFWQKNGIHTIFLSSESQVANSFENKIFSEAERNKVNVVLVPDITQNDFFSYELSYLESQPILTPIKFPLDFASNYFLKRIFDILVSLLFLILIGSWLFPLTALLIRSDSKGFVFFKQKRYGYHDEIFTLFKFRTMFVNEQSDCKTTEKNDKRITKIGRFLRTTSLDETPQFLNVLRGEMSVVGPRPHMISVDNFYKPKIDRYNLRSNVKPGLTGLAQINGQRGDKDDMELEMRKRILSDAFYVKNWSMSLDLIIILKTIILLLKGDKNAH